VSIPADHFWSEFDLSARLERNASRLGSKAAIIYPGDTKEMRGVHYQQLSYSDLQARVAEVAAGLSSIGIGLGTRTILLASGPDLFIIGFALLHLGAVPVLVDPGIGIRRVLHCYRTVNATAFIGLPVTHLLRLLCRRTFRQISVRVTVGRRWFWGGHTLSRLPGRSKEAQRASVRGDSLAMIGFTTGSTGPAKGVEYTYQMINSMTQQVRDSFGHAERDVSLVTLPAHGVFDLLAGSTVVLAPVSPGRLARANPAALVDALLRFHVSAMFASPVLFHTLADYLASNQCRLPELRCIVVGGASVPASQVAAMLAALNDQAKIHITYGATEALLITSIESTETLSLAAPKNPGSGFCVGRPVAGTEVKIIGIREGRSANEAGKDQPLPIGHIGEVAVTGDSVSRHYYRNPESDFLHKFTLPGIQSRTWHRTGDAGYFDDSGRLWLCGRISQRVQTASGDLYPLCCEPIFDAHRLVRRSALVGIVDANSQRYQTPVVCVELKARMRFRKWHQVAEELHTLAVAEPATAQLRIFLRHPSFPVDARHNSKIRREELASWAARKIGRPNS
jgi:olefin beta-lactone synthetase